MGDLANAGIATTCPSPKLYPACIFNHFLRRAKGRRRDRQEIDRDHLSDVIVEKCAPGL
jgi:hypothetical protein